MRPELIVLDLAGTTLDEGGAILDAFRIALDRVGIPVTPDELNAARGANKAQVIRQFALRALGPGPQTVTVAREALEMFNDEVAIQFRDGGLVPFDGVQVALEQIKAAGLRLATNTGLNRSLADAALNQLGWHGGLFDAHICGDDVPAGRPAPYMIYLAMERADVRQAARVVVVGDTPLDLQAGANAGAGGVVGVLTGSHGVETLGRTRHTHILPSVANLPALLAAEFAVEGLTDR